MKKKKISVSRIVIFVFLAVLAIICVLPFYSMIISATRSSAELARGMGFTPGKNLLPNYKELTRIVPIWKWFLNSLLISVPSTVLTGYFGGLTAYGFEKFRWRGQKILYWVVLSTMMIPTQVTLIGLFQISKIYGVLNTYIPLIVPAIANGATVFWMRSSIESSIDDAYIEAARMDGCSELSIFNRIVLPLLKPALATISILNFVGSWNNYMGPLILINTVDKYPMALGIAVLKQMDKSDFGVIHTGIAISIVPIMVVFTFLSKKIIGGLTVGGVKG